MTDTRHAPSKAKPGDEPLTAVQVDEIRKGVLSREGWTPFYEDMINVCFAMALRQSTPSEIPRTLQLSMALDELHSLEEWFSKAHYQPDHPALLSLKVIRAFLQSPTYPKENP